MPAGHDGTEPLDEVVQRGVPLRDLAEDRPDEDFGAREAVDVVVGVHPGGAARPGGRHRSRAAAVGGGAKGRRSGSRTQSRRDGPADDRAIIAVAGGRGAQRQRAWWADCRPSPTTYQATIDARCGSVRPVPRVLQFAQIRFIPSRFIPSSFARPRCLPATANDVGGRGAASKELFRGGGA